MKFKTVQFLRDEEIVTRVQKKKSLGNFQAIGRINNMYDKSNETTDIFKQLRKVSKPAFELFDDLKENRNPHNNLCFIDTSKLTKSQLVMHTSRLKELKQVGLIKKAKTIDLRDPVKKGSFMINPGCLRPNVNNYEELEAMWRLLK